MASWWLPIPMIKVLARLKRGDVLICDEKERYYWQKTKKKCSGTAKAMANRGLIYKAGYGGEMAITGTGFNELGYNSNRIPDDLDA